MEVRGKYGLPADYILYVGTIQPRKNLGTLIEAYARLKKERGIANRLVITGRKGWLYDRLFARLKELALGDEVIFTGFVPDEELPYIYDGAKAFVYLSFFEGFGLPPLEAMACGVPVITSNTTSLPEVVGDAGIALPPKDVEGVTAALARILTDPETAAAMKEKGLRRARTFSWESTARQTLEIYGKIAASRTRSSKLKAQSSK